MDTIINQMKTLGLTEYEIKTYIALLQNHPINGYSLSKASGVPRSRTYEVLDSLSKKNLVFEIKEGNATTYTPLEPSLLIKKMKADFENTIKSVDSYTNHLYTTKQMDLGPKILKGRTAILEMVKVLIGEANHRIALSVWDEEIQVIKRELDQAKERNVLLRGVYFGKDNPYDELIPHRRIDRYVAEKEERYLIIVIDDLHVISGIISRDEETKVRWSNDPGIIEMSDDSIAHDVMLNTYSAMLQGKDKAAYENTLDSVRKEYYGLSDEEFERLPLPSENN